MVSFRITKNGFIGNGSGSLTGSLLGTASHATTASSVAWNNVTGKPSAYPAAAHDHTGNNLKPASVTTTGDITVGGNLVVQGNMSINGVASVIDQTHLNVADTLVLLASGSTSQAAANGAGIAIQTSSAATQEDREAASARIQYRSSDNHFTASVGFVAPSFTGSLQGTATSASFALDAALAAFVADVSAAVAEDAALFAEVLALLAYLPAFVADVLALFAEVAAALADSAAKNAEAEL